MTSKTGSRKQQHLKIIDEVIQLEEEIQEKLQRLYELRHKAALLDAEMQRKAVLAYLPTDEQTNYNSDYYAKLLAIKKEIDAGTVSVVWWKSVPFNKNRIEKAIQLYEFLNQKI